MNVEVDPRLAARRKSVQEGWARRRLRWMMVLVGIVLFVGVAIAVAESPWLAVKSIEISGAEQADVEGLVASADVTVGTPTFSVKEDRILAALRSDPWIAEAEVRVTWPGTVAVTVLERTPAAWVRLDGTWGLAAVDGVIVAVGEPEDGEPFVHEPAADVRVGQRITAPDLLGAIELLGHLPPDLAVGASAEVTREGIEAQVAGHVVLAGTSRDMSSKAATLEAIFEAGVEQGAVINVISPLRPGVSNPGSVVESFGQDVSSFDESS